MVLDLVSVNKLMKKIDTYFNQKFDDFGEYKEQFDAAVCSLRNSWSEENVQELIAAYNQRVAAVVLYAGNNGYQSCLDQCRNPDKDFLQWETEQMVWEEMMRRMPAYVQAQTIISLLSRTLPDEIHRNINDYYLYLDTVAPRIAHYEGFMLANRLLHYTEPVYYMDYMNLLQYQKMMQEYYGAEFSI